MNLLYSTEFDSQFGKISILSDGETISGLWLPGQNVASGEVICFGKVVKVRLNEGDCPDIFITAHNWLKRYFKGENPGVTPPLSLLGTPFRLSVWRLLQDIPYGKVTTYGEIARLVERQTGVKTISAQAVGGAVGHNPISIMIPCHRVVGSNGSLTGYAGGISIKYELLRLEQIDMSRFFIHRNGF